MANEKWLIYADSGKESVEYLKRHLIVGDSEFLRGYLQGVEALADVLAKLPPVDVVEVVHGRWEQIGYDKAMDRISCSCCKEYWNIADNDTDTFNYCPNCGAKMDGDGNG